jgi:hypothetical protein
MRRIRIERIGHTDSHRFILVQDDGIAKFNCVANLAYFADRREVFEALVT